MYVCMYVCMCVRSYPALLCALSSPVCRQGVREEWLKELFLLDQLLHMLLGKPSGDRGTRVCISPSFHDQL